MIGQYLSNTNEKATVSILQNILELNEAPNTFPASGAPYSFRVSDFIRNDLCPSSSSVSVTVAETNTKLYLLNL